MSNIELLFTHMDNWRHFPNYQLERRADIFFSLYMHEVLEKKLGFKLKKDLIPEFPIRIGTIDTPKSSNRSKKIDYLAISESGDKAVFVELKTDKKSGNKEQDNYLSKSQEAGLPALLDGLLGIFRATKSKHKYYHLLKQLEFMGQVQLTAEFHKIMSRASLRGINEESKNIKITTQVKDCHLIYVQPTDEGPLIVSFKEFSSIVQLHKDPLSQRFAKSLLEWAETNAGELRDI